MSDARYKDAEWLHEQYHEKELSTYEIADKCGVYDTTVGKWMDKYDIERRGYGQNNCRTGVGIVDQDGYQRWHEASLGKYVRIHRLLAVAEYGFDAVCDMDVHHQNGIKWDNRPDNIELMTRSEHAAHHAREQFALDDTRHRDAEWLKEQYHEHELSTHEIADKCVVNARAVSYWMKKYDIERRGTSGDARYKDAEWLHEQYHEKELSTYEIADKCGVYDTTVGKWMEKHDIERRDRGGMSSAARYKDAEWLHEQYHDKGLTQYEVADKCDVGQKTVSYWMEKHGIERRDRRGTSSAARYKDAEWLHGQYHEHELSQREIAEKCDVSQNTVSHWMKKQGIERREPGHNLRSDKPTGQLTLDDTRKLEGAQTVNQ